MNIAGILLCAGSSERMGKNKLLQRIGGKTVMEMSFNALASAGLSKIIIAVSEVTADEAERLQNFANTDVTIINGGSTRGKSVYAALKQAKGADIAVIHDAARCLADKELILNCIESAQAFGSGIAAIPARDTLRYSDGRGCVDREGLLLMQTPQAFAYERIMKAYEKAESNGTDATDDCALYESMGYKPCYVTGSIANQKLTVPGDMTFFERFAGASRTGYGEDTHILSAGRPLILGGVRIPHEKGLLGHSDADVLTHAIIDALMGAANLGDIGRSYPDTDEQYRGICSLILLRDTGKRIRDEGYKIEHIDMTIIAEAPKLMPYIESMRHNIAEALEIVPMQVSVKATTTEGTGPEGRQECITARGVAAVSC
ncbi:MAG: Bifunctional enzyme IspD/IspF [Firmicutes bacterium ADurb.Bin182]|nr:MAG: Bifunctional enzyme IspD/IspF [Firmicutes bacterium ADurb.Bin182]